MRISLKKLKRYIVETKSGVVLGRVNDIVLQTDGQLVAQYIVKSSMLGGKEYIVSRDQVVDFQEKKLVVDDSVGVEKNLGGEEKRSTSSPEPAVMREAE